MVSFKRITAITAIIGAFSATSVDAKKKVSKHDDTQVLHHGEPSYSCPPGFNLNGKQCMRKMESPKIPFCQTGILDDAGRCADFVIAHAVCPDGYILEGAECVRHTTAQRIAICPTGYNMVDNLGNVAGGKMHNGVYGGGYGGHNKKKEGGFVQLNIAQCAREISVPLQHFCPPGTVDTKNHQCIKYAAVPPFYHCQGPDYKLQGDRCTRVIHYDCSPNAPSPLAQNAPIGLLEGAKKHLRQLGKKIKKDIIIPQTYAKNEPPTKEHFIVSQQCKKIEDIPALKSCPKGSVPEGKGCQVTKTIAKLSKCPARGNIEHCFDIENVEANYVCPPGFNDAHLAGAGLGINAYGSKKGGAYFNDECTNVELAASALVCGNGGQLIGEKCMVYTKPDYHCQDNDKHTHKKGYGSLNNLDCSYFDFAEPIVTYSVKYACTGKDCHPGNGHGHGHGHGH